MTSRSAACRSLTLIALVAGLFAFAWTSATAAPHKPGKKYAIVIGINRYERQDITSLTCAVSDAHLFAQALRALHYDKVYEMTSDVPRDSDYYPTSNNIGFQLGNIRRIMDEEGTTRNTFVFFYSGHGMELKHEGKSKGDTYLVAIDTDIRNPDVLKKSAYRFADVKDIIERMKAQHVLVVFDACRNDPHGGRASADNRLTGAAARDLTLTAHKGPEPQVMATLFACSPGQRSYEWQKRGHGFFTYFLVEGLKGKAVLPGTRHITLKSLADYCAKAVKDATQDAGYSQSPWLNADGPPDWVVATAADTSTVARIHDTTTPPPTGPSRVETPARTHTPDGTVRTTTTAPAKPVQDDGSAAYAGYVRGTSTLGGFSPDQTVFDQVLKLVQTEHVDAPSDAKLFAGVATEMGWLLKAVDRDSSALGSLPTDASLPQRIAQTYGDQVDRSLLYYAMMRGLMKGTDDPFSVLMTPEDYRLFKESMQSLTFGGLGIFIELDKEADNQLTVLEPIEGGPGYRAGLQSGDQIVAIDGRSTQGVTIEQASTALRGAIGTVVRLTIRRRGAAQLLEFTLTREAIRPTSVTGKMLNDIGYVKLRIFAENTGRELGEVLRSLEQKGAKGLIVDLRNNGGGYLTAALDVCGSFTDPDLLVTYTVDRKGSRKDYKSATRSIDRLPLVLLVNNYSASASEIVASYLKEYNRAMLVGTRTFGKGSIQQLFDLPGGACVKLTTAHYFTPRGNKVDKVGLQPDFVVPMETRLIGHEGDVQLQKALEVLHSRAR